MLFHELRSREASSGKSPRDLLFCSQFVIRDLATAISECGLVNIEYSEVRIAESVAAITPSG